MNDATHRDVAQWQVVARLNVSRWACLNRIALLQLLRRENVTLLAIREVQQRDAGRPVRIVLNVSNLRRHAILVSPTEVNDPISALVATALMTGRDLAGVVTSTLFVKRANK